MLESYHGGATSTMKKNKRHSKELTIQEKNGGTWPKARATNMLQNDTGTIVARKKDRPPLSLVINNNQNDEYFEGISIRNSTPVPISVGQTVNRHSTSKSFDNPPHFSKMFTNVNDSYEKLKQNKISDFDSNRLSMNMKSDDSFCFKIPPLISEKDIFNYNKKNKTGIIKSNSDSERDSLVLHDIPISSVPHSRTHSHILGPPVRMLNSYHPHRHPHSNTSPLNFPQSTDNCCCVLPETPYYMRPLLSDYNKRSIGLPSHTHTPYRDSDIISCSPGYEGGTYPRKKENQRIRIPSNPSVTSKNSGSIERTSEGGSPMPIFEVEVLSPGSSSKRNSVPDYCWPQKPLPGELRRVHIDKSNEPLGIQINCPESGGIFVSSVNDNSLASRVGLQIGDQLLEVCGINMRSATYNLAANVLRQCGNSITMLVQYSPDSK